MHFLDFSLEQIIPATDETTGAELEIIGASFCDPYVSLIRSDSTITVYQSTSTELEELERGDSILSAKWLSASAYKPPNVDEPLLFALTAEGALRVSFCGQKIWTLTDCILDIPAVKLEHARVLGRGTRLLATHAFIRFRASTNNGQGDIDGDHSCGYW
jgi:hypothetical protein